MERETIEYNGKKYHRYPNAKKSNHRHYYTNHSDSKKPPVSLHRQIWMDHYGEIPKGHHIHHKDGNFDNNSIENLECISASEHRKKHPASEETRAKYRELIIQRDPLGKWRKENPELCKQVCKENGAKSKSLEKWKKENKILASKIYSDAGKKSQRIQKEKRDSIQFDS